MREELVEKMTDEQVARLTALEAKKEKAFRLQDTQRQLQSAPKPCTLHPNPETLAPVP